MASVFLHVASLTIFAVCHATDAHTYTSHLIQQFHHRSPTDSPTESLVVQSSEDVQFQLSLMDLSAEDLVHLYNASLAAEERARLLQGRKHSEGSEDAFVDVNSAFKLLPPYVDHAPREYNQDGKKNLVETDSLKSKKCLVYAAGIADDSRFEQDLALSGCEVHAFDCTIDPSSPAVLGKAFHFHKWCLGQGKKNSKRLKSSTYARDLADSYVFKTLEATMIELGHSSLDLLKFDIEGFEWDLFRDSVLVAPSLPVQLSFELHTAGANRLYVPPENVQDKKRKEVDDLFLKLYDLGYRVVSKEINLFDRHCAEFIVVNVDSLARA